MAQRVGDAERFQCHPDAEGQVEKHHDPGLVHRQLPISAHEREYHDRRDHEEHHHRYDLSEVDDHRAGEDHGERHRNEQVEDVAPQHVRKT